MLKYKSSTPTTWTLPRFKIALLRCNKNSFKTLSKIKCWQRRRHYVFGIHKNDQKCDRWRRRRCVIRECRNLQRTKNEKFFPKNGGSEWAIYRVTSHEWVTTPTPRFKTDKNRLKIYSVVVFRNKQCDQIVRLFFNIWPFASMKISPIMSQICPKRKKQSKICQIPEFFCQSGDILSNLVTLVWKVVN